MKIDLIPYRKKNKWGFCAIDKTIIIECIYDNVGFFSEGLAAVCLSGKWGFIYEDGKFAIPFFCGDVKNFSENACAVAINGIWGYIDKSGKEIIPFEYRYAGNFSNGIAEIIGEDDNRGYINALGKAMPPPLINQTSGFAEGIVFFSKRIGITEFASGIIDNNGNEILPAILEDYSIFSEGLCAVKYNGKWGYINWGGNIAIPFNYDYAFDFKEGLAGVVLDRKIGYINRFGEIKIPFENDIFSYAIDDRCNSDEYICDCSFLNGVAPIIKGNLLGYMDEFGRILIDCKFRINDFEFFRFGYSQSGFQLPIFENDIIYLEPANGYISKNGIEYFEN